jgi:hypothetical protein
VWSNRSMTTVAFLGLDLYASAPRVVEIGRRASEPAAVPAANRTVRQGWEKTPKALLSRNCTLSERIMLTISKSLSVDVTCSRSLYRLRLGNIPTPSFQHE